MLFHVLQLLKRLQVVRTGRLTRDVEQSLKMISESAAVEGKLTSPDTYSQVICDMEEIILLLIFNLITRFHVISQSDIVG